MPPCSCVKSASRNNHSWYGDVYFILFCIEGNDIQSDGLYAHKLIMNNKQIVEFYIVGYGIEEIANELELTESTVLDVLEEAGIFDEY